MFRTHIQTFRSSRSPSCDVFCVATRTRTIDTVLGQANLAKLPSFALQMYPRSPRRSEGALTVVTNLHRVYTATIVVLPVSESGMACSDWFGSDVLLLVSRSSGYTHCGIAAWPLTVFPISRILDAEQPCLTIAWCNAARCTAEWN